MDVDGESVDVDVDVESVDVDVESGFKFSFVVCCCLASFCELQIIPIVKAENKNEFNI